ncbi:hypothetical protein BACPEC_02475 [[Bacteroides] pectinophilus ATCC 43243]|uniref:Uncharacterized protein n=1 Tax=[Bacteroides] pectinophilus ATCC 43243 TaxID=483218 RepID=B7AUS7_9FIRM|nr:hypothetical protein BACPEC_02475 [[Bacteroides] pectinophilus ATCC 43243]
MAACSIYKISISVYFKMSVKMLRTDISGLPHKDSGSCQGLHEP